MYATSFATEIDQLTNGAIPVRQTQKNRLRHDFGRQNDQSHRPIKVSSEDSPIGSFILESLMGFAFPGLSAMFNTFGPCDIAEFYDQSRWAIGGRSPAKQTSFLQKNNRGQPMPGLMAPVRQRKSLLNFILG